MAYDGYGKVSKETAKILLAELMASFPSPIINDFELYATDKVKLLMEYDEPRCIRAIKKLLQKCKKPPTHAEMYEALQDSGAQRIVNKTMAGDLELFGNNDKRRQALCHAWMRARDYGDPKAENMLLKFTRDEIATAQRMSLATAIEHMPGIASRLSKPIEQYGRVGEYAYRVPAAEFEHIWNKKVRIEDSKSLFEQVREIMNKTEPHFETRGWELSEPTDKQHGGDDEQASSD